MSLVQKLLFFRDRISLDRGYRSRESLVEDILVVLQRDVRNLFAMIRLVRDHNGRENDEKDEGENRDRRRKSCRGVEEEGLYRSRL
jgi:hypothetical protein